jgi:5-methylcytosine-specific restriction endonuclease McrA
MQKRKGETLEQWRARKAAYDFAWRVERKALLIDMLGGKCVDCGITVSLEFDHIDPRSKTFDVAGNLSLKLETLINEANKCVLRCTICHAIRTATQKINNVNVLGDIA